MATPHRGLPVPAGADVPDVPLWMGALATALDFDLFVIETLPRPAAGTLGRVHHDPGTGAWSLDTGAAWVALPTGGPYLPTAGGALTGFLDLAGNELRSATLVENRQKVTTVAAAGANRNLDAGASPLYDVTLDQNVTFTFAGVDGDRLFLLLRQPAAVKTVAWPATLDWPGAVAPAQTANTAVFYMFTRVAGRWVGYAQAVASGGKASVIVKNADESVTSSITLQDDDELTVALAANTDYAFSIWLRTTSGGGGTNGSIKCALTVPAGATLQFSGIWEGSAGPQTADPILATATALPMPLNGTSNCWARIDGTVRNGANAGNLTLQWAQNTSSGTATVVKAGSSLTLVKE